MTFGQAVREFTTDERMDGEDRSMIREPVILRVSFAAPVSTASKTITIFGVLPVKCTAHLNY